MKVRHDLKAKTCLQGMSIYMVCNNTYFAGDNNVDISGNQSMIYISWNMTMATSYPSFLIEGCFFYCSSSNVNLDLSKCRHSLQYRINFHMTFGLDRNFIFIAVKTIHKTLVFVLYTYSIHIIYKIYKN